MGDITRQEPPLARTIEVWCANVRPKRMDWAIEKCVEAGVNVFRPIVTERSVRGRAISQKRHERWERIAIEAMEQCGRLYLPMITPATPLMTALQSRWGTLVLAHSDGVPWGEAVESLPQRGRLALVIGPEGGFSDEELARAKEESALLVSLGPNAFRTETAAVVATALANA